ncbi:B12-binding domain-containing radical SAM protein [Nitrospinae bacterium]|nr:B12-binding domain-containing radical SAM protein [Nitrospinota bacterium]
MDKKKNPKILIVTTPIRPIPTNFPPYGSLSVMTALKKAGFNDTTFFNIDLLRPKYSEVIKYIKETKPDILGISAVVSTAYDFTKKLSIDIKRFLPGTTIILGGNLGASAEILLKKTGVDFICTGEGEITSVSFARAWMTADCKNSYSKVQGLAFLDDEKKLVNTPYPPTVPAEEVYDIDWSILDDLGQMEYFVVNKEFSPHVNAELGDDPRKYQPHRDGKTIFNVVGSKGCVARCTFCHRWDKGIRYIPVPVLMERIDRLIQDYNLGFVDFADENFGSDKKWLKQLLPELKKRDLLWMVGGMRVNTLSSEWIDQMKLAGCLLINCGMESGSQKMLDVMEKKTKVEQNFNAVQWMVEKEVNTVIQLIIGMPGETPETIEDTCKFVSFFTEQSPNVNPLSLSINFAQALPGTPLYEMARSKSQIGQTLEKEEEYLIKISDRDARDGETYINFTDYPKLVLEKWHFDIQNRARHSYLKKWGAKNYYNIIVTAPRFQPSKGEEHGSDQEDTGYYADPARSIKNSNGKNKWGMPASSHVSDTIHDINKSIKLINNKVPSFWTLLKKRKFGDMAWFFPNYFWHARHFLILFAIINSFRKFGKKYALKMLLEYLRWKIKNIFFISRKQSIKEYISLRKLLRDDITSKILTDNPMMVKLREGR